MIVQKKRQKTRFFCGKWVEKLSKHYIIEEDCIQSENGGIYNAWFWADDRYFEEES